MLYSNRLYNGGPRGSTSDVRLPICLRINPSISKSYVNPLELLICHLQHIINAQPKYGRHWPSHIDTAALHRMSIFTLKMSSVLMTYDICQEWCMDSSPGLVISLGHIRTVIIYQNIRVGHHYNFYDHLGNEYPTYHANGTF